MEYEYMTSGINDVVLDDGVGQSLYHYNNQAVPSTGGGRRSWRPELSDDPAPAPAKPAPAPMVVPPPAPEKSDAKMLLGLGLGAGALTAAGVWGLMRWANCPAAQDTKSIAQVAGVAALSSVVAAVAVKKLA